MTTCPADLRLVWIADVYPDDTFDFAIRYRDSFGQPSVTVACTCYIRAAYNNYYPDEIRCTCDPSNSSDTCNIYYDQI